MLLAFRLTPKFLHDVIIMPWNNYNLNKLALALILKNVHTETGTNIENTESPQDLL